MDMEDIDDSVTNDAAHNRLINAVTKLDKTQHIKNPTRSEPTNLRSEFNLIKTSNKIDINNVVKVLENTAHHVQISKNLKKTQDTSKILPKPLEKIHADRIKRSTGYEETKKKVGRWDAVVARSRTLDYLVFPLKRGSDKLQPTSDFLTKLKLKSPLELELEKVDPHPVVEEEEEEPVYPMTYLEMVEQRQHLAKIRAQESFKAAKAKRQSKIKSKKYHRVLKKEKLKQQLKEFEELQITNPEEALKKLEALEKERALERHTLRHKNTGKWAKNKMIRAKYDKEVRQQLAEQLAVSRNLTNKIQTKESSDDEANDNEGVSDVTLSQDPLNPWMFKRPEKSNVDTEFDFAYKNYLNDKIVTQNNFDSADENEEMPKAKEENVCDVSKKTHADSIKNDVHIVINSVENLGNDNASKMISNVLDKINCDQKQPKITNEANHKKKVNAAVATSNWVVETIEDSKSKVLNLKHSDISNAFEVLETGIAAQVANKLKHLRENIENLEHGMKKQRKVTEKSNNDISNFEYLQFKNHNQKAVLDEELIETSTSNNAEEIKKPEISVNALLKQPIDQELTNNNIDPSRFVQAKPKYLNTAITEGDNDLDQLDDDEQVVPKVNIEEVLEEDDVVASFRQEKEDEINNDKPKDIDLSLPGWGSWGGKGVKAPRRKKNRFILKGAVKMPRRDENKGDIIIKEYKDPKLSAHKVTEVPFPFTSVKEYEGSIRAPLGNTFIPEKAHRKVIRPNVITKAGAIIEPMDEDELLVPRNQAFRNKSVMKLLAKNKIQT